MSGLEDELEQKGEQEAKEKIDSELGGSSAGGQQDGGTGGDQHGSDQQGSDQQGSDQQGSDPNAAQDPGAGGSHLAATGPGAPKDASEPSAKWAR